MCFLLSVFALFFSTKIDTFLMTKIHLLHVKQLELLSFVSWRIDQIEFILLKTQWPILN